MSFRHQWGVQAGETLNITVGKYSVSIIYGVEWGIFTTGLLPWHRR